MSCKHSPKEHVLNVVFLFITIFAILVTRGPAQAMGGDQPLDQSLVEQFGTRSDRGQCAQGATDRGEPQERRSAGCADLGAAGQD